MRDRILPDGLAIAPATALENLPREVAAAEPEGQRQREDEPAEEDAEGDQHHVAADADLDERGGHGEQEDDPAGGARQEAGLENTGVDRGDQYRLTEEVGGEPADHHDQDRGQQARQEP